MSNEDTWKRKVRALNASTKRHGPKLTAKPDTAGRIRCPKTGEVHPVGTPIYNKWREALAT